MNGLSSMPGGETKHLLGTRARGRGFIECVERAKVDQSSVHFDVGDKSNTSPSVWLHSSATRNAIGSNSAIHQVAGGGCFTEIAPTVVRPVAVNVVYKFWPPASLDGESNSMRGKQFGAKVAHGVTDSIDCGERRLACTSRVPLSAPDFGGFARSRLKVSSRAFKPCKHPGSGVVMHPVAKIADVGQFTFSHVESLHSCGQGRALCNQRFRPVFSSAILLFFQGSQSFARSRTLVALSMVLGMPWADFQRGLPSVSHGTRKKTEIAA